MLYGSGQQHKRRHMYRAAACCECPQVWIDKQVHGAATAGWNIIGCLRTTGAGGSNSLAPSALLARHA